VLPCRPTLWIRNPQQGLYTCFLACSRPKDMTRRKERSCCGYSMSTPSPSPSTSSPPISVPVAITISSVLGVPSNLHLIIGNTI